MNTTTYHSIQRAMERCDMPNEGAAGKNIRRAAQYGKRAEDYASWEHNYLSSEGKGGCEAVAYNGFCYIFGDDNVCVTVYQLPKWFGKKKHYDGKEKIRNYRKYFKSNEDYRERCAVC